VNSEKLADWLRHYLARALDVAPARVDPNRPFAELGVDSKTGLEMLGALERVTGRPIDVATLYDHPNIMALASAVCSRVESGDARTGEQLRADEPIAIVGIGCRFPGARGPREYWTLLTEGRSGISVPDHARLELAPELEGVAGGWLDGLGEFDSAFFGISPREAQMMDPQQRLLLEVSRECLEDGYIDLKSLSGRRVGVFVGLSTNDYSRMQPTFEPQAVVGNALSIAANRISYFYDLSGPSLTVDTACSSSLTALDLAATALRSGDVELALVGGANVILSRAVSDAFDKANLMAADGQCKTFDDRADGYVRGEGVGFVLLKRLGAAIEARDRIYAIVLGSQVVQDGRTNGLMAPSARAQVAAIDGACRRAGVSAAELSYVEAHGTGTHLGDVVELSALGRALTTGGLSAEERQLEQRVRKCRLGSVKTNIGHLEAAAGVASLIKMALSVYHRKLPPSLNFDMPNSRVDWASLPVEVQTELTPWPASELSLPRSCDRYREAFAGRGHHVAGVSSFGFGGTNVHAVLMSPPTSPDDTRAQRSLSTTVLTFSAQSAGDVPSLAGAYRKLLDTVDEAEFRRIARASLRCRSADRHRVAIVARSKESAAQDLAALAAGSASASVEADDTARVAIVFTGQGDQWTGMGEELYRADGAFREKLVELNDIVRRLAGWSPIEMMFSRDNANLKATTYAQPTIFALQAALLHCLQDCGVTPHAVIGHSMGEITALYAAGILTAERALKILLARGRLIDSADLPAGGMLVVRGQARSDVELLARKLAPTITLAADNGPRAVVLAGPRDDVASLQAELTRRHVACALLPVSYGFHNSLTVRADREFLQAAADSELGKPIRQLYSTVSGDSQEAIELNEAYWVRSVEGTVEFRAAVERAMCDGCRTFVELGPKPVLSKHIEAIGAAAAHGNVSVHALLDEGKSAADGLRAALAELFLRGVAVSRFEQATTLLRAPAALPMPVWHRQRYWLRSSSQAARRVKGFLYSPTVLAGLAHTVLVLGRIEPESDAFIRDHGIRGVAVVPAAVWLEVLLESADAVGAVAIADVQLIEMWPFTEEPIELQVLLTGDGSSAHQAVLSARTAGREWRTVARCRVGSYDAVSRLVDRDEALARCFNHYDEHPLYAMLRARGYEYGPEFRRVKEVWFSDDEAFGEVRASASARLTQFQIDPALLDACFHVAAASLESSYREDAGFLVPTSVSRLKLLRTPRTEASVHLSVRDVSAAECTVDLSIFDREGQCVQVDALKLSPGRRGEQARKPLASANATFYRQVWRPWRESAPLDATVAGHWVVFTGKDPLANELVTGLRERGHRVATVSYSHRFVSDGDTFSIRAGDRNDLDALMVTIGKAGDVAGLIDAWGLDAAVSPEEPLREDACAERLMDTLQSWSRSGGGRAPNLYVLTRGAQAVAGDAVRAPAQASVWGFAKAVPFEHPNIVCVRIDVAPDESPGADLVLRAVLANESEDQIAIRRDTLYVHRLERVDPASVTVRKPKFSSDGIVLVSGGGGGLARSVVRSLVAVGARNIVLLGRSKRTLAEVLDPIGPLPPGVNVDYEVCDVADLEQLRSVVARVSRRNSRIEGVVHLAGTLDDGAILKLSRDRLNRVLTPKVRGAFNLWEVAKDQPLELFLMFSSVAPVFGSPGQASYMAANATLDALASYFRSRSVPALSIGWGPWAERGMAADSRLATKSRAASITMFDPAEAEKLLEDLMGLDAHHLVVTPFDVRHLVQYYPAKLGVRYFEDIMADELATIRSDGGQERIYRRPKLDKPFVAPATHLERSLCELWSRSLGMIGIGVNDEFFELGGDSVFASQVLAEINEQFGVQIDPARAYEEFTIAHLAGLIIEGRNERSGPSARTQCPNQKQEQT
jgi:acyl transferase domain-containing protein/acyl carrier protein